MNGTPRLRSAFPSTPQAKSPGQAQYGSPSNASKLSSSLPDVGSLSSAQADPNAPLIPFEVIDAPAQRAYVAGFYAVLLFWRFYDFFRLHVDDDESLWLFMKWIAIDGIFLFGLPGLRIPWLEWSSVTMTLLFLVHALLDGVLMFRIPIPFEAALIGFTRLLYDRELAIAERKVKPADILRNSSLILGRQTIHVLPEGSAFLNPNQEHFCLDDFNLSVQLPIQINQTTPILIELLRLDLEDGTNETTTILASQLKKLKREADKAHDPHETATPRLLKFTVKKPGLYRLQRVVDESKLEVRKRVSDTLVVRCPQARFSAPNAHRCRNELSDLTLEVLGTPPLKVTYRKTVNGETRDVSFQSIQPDDLVSPLLRHKTSGPLISRDSTDVTWARMHRVNVPLNETMTSAGSWEYTIEEVSDALGNAVSYSGRDGHHGRTPSLGSLQQALYVHERPRAELHGCDLDNPIKVAKGRSVSLPVRYDLSGKPELRTAPHTLTYLFTATQDLTASAEQGPQAKLKQVTVNNINELPSISEAGLYALQSVSTQYCDGEILEPSSCLLENPPEPDLTISAEEISDKCAGNPVGLRISLDLLGTPPFHVEYTMHKRGDRHHRMDMVKVEGLRGHLELVPLEAGHYTYLFTSVSDNVYKGHSIKHKNLILEQDVRPSASAYFLDGNEKRQLCIDQSASFEVVMQGAGPWQLEYEMVHGSKRIKRDVLQITSERYAINTGPLTNGGDYTVTLMSVTDRMGCKEYLQQEARMSVRHQKPKASFGLAEGRRSLRALEGKYVSLPIRVTGEAPWTLKYRNHETSPDREESVQIKHPNDVIKVSKHGTYEITDIHDKFCPGAVDESANRFEVKLIERPSLNVVESPTITLVGGTYVKNDICEGDEDTLDITLTGNPPYDVKYREIVKPDQGSKRISSRELSVPLGLASIKMDSSVSGLHEYEFTELADYNYPHDPKRYKAINVRQHVSPRPSARFATPGKTYGYCAVQHSGEEVIPVTLTGIPPFVMEIEIKHRSAARPETFHVPNIASTAYSLRIPHHRLELGLSTVAIRQVRDARGCTSSIDPGAAKVQISVNSAPQITAVEERTDFCVGERISFTLTGVPSFQVFYTFEGKERKATSNTHTFRRLAEKPGVFSITGLKDSASDCKFDVSSPWPPASNLEGENQYSDMVLTRPANALNKTIHPLPSVTVSHGRDSYVDIHEGGEAELVFEFTGAPPFDFTYTRSTLESKNGRSEILETKTGRSEGFVFKVMASLEGVYEVQSVRDSWCAVSRAGGVVTAGKSGGQEIRRRIT